MRGGNTARRVGTGKKGPWGLRGASLTLPRLSQLSTPFLPLQPPPGKPSLSSLQGSGAWTGPCPESIPTQPQGEALPGRVHQLPCDPVPGQASPGIQDPKLRSKRVAAAP